MNRPTKDLTKKTTTREQMLALLTGDDALRALLETTVQKCSKSRWTRRWAPAKANARAPAGATAAATTAGS